MWQLFLSKTLQKMRGTGRRVILMARGFRESPCGRDGREAKVQRDDVAWEICDAAYE
jgi:hypothetical protein